MIISVLKKVYMKILNSIVLNKTQFNFVNKQATKKYNNLSPLKQDTVSFSSKTKIEQKTPIIIEDLNDPVLDSIKDITQKHDCYVVGGYMRDYFNGKGTPHDWDLMCTDDSRALAKEIAESKQGTFIPLDEERGIYRVVLQDKTTEFDIAQAIENDIYLDSKRRDFTLIFK